MAKKTNPTPLRPIEANAKLKLGLKGEALIKEFENCMRAIGGGMYAAYRDPVGVATIGWGHTNHHGRKFKMGDKWSKAECDAEFRSDAAQFEDEVKRLVRVPLSQDQFDALVSFAYNVGGGNLRKSTLLRKLNAGDYEGAVGQFVRWNKAGGRVLRGLTRRRLAEARLFRGLT